MKIRTPATDLVGTGRGFERRQLARMPPAPNSLPPTSHGLLVSCILKPSESAQETDRGTVVSRIADIPRRDNLATLILRVRNGERALPGVHLVLHVRDHLTHLPELAHRVLIVAYPPPARDGPLGTSG